MTRVAVESGEQRRGRERTPTRGGRGVSDGEDARADGNGRDGSSPFDGADGRDGARALLAVCCVLVVLFAALLVPLVSAGGLASTPLGSTIPVPGFAGESGGTEGGSGADRRGGTGSTAGGGLGALNPTDQTGVGGSLADENATNPFRTLGNETHFVVRATDSTYWRTGAYDRYTGEGWERTGESRPYDDPIETSGLPGDELRYEVTLRQSASGLPTAWRPRSVSLARPLELLVTDESAVRVGDPVPAGTTFEGVSSVSVRDVPTLRSTGRGAPTAIEDRYTQLPDSTRERLAPFVANLTDSRNPYETAVAVESWLETEKTYSLEVSQSPNEDVATQFVFEMEAGYCEYFATSMVAMLRSQGIPARYVVGYSPGQPTGPNEYTVRGMNAHAWVEVYFPDVGWVRFDPTPGAARLAAEQEALNESDEELNTTEEGSPGENQSVGTPTPSATPTPAPTTATPTATPTPTPDDGTSTATPTPDLSVSLNRSAVPGATVEVTVTRGEGPVEGALVRFNDDPVGETDANGTVVGEVPYERELRVTVGGSDESFARSLGAPPPDPDRQYAVDAAPLARFQQGNTTVEYPLDANASVSVSGDRVTGGEVVVSAAVSDVPVRNGTVTLDGERVGTTDRSGRLTLTLPRSPGNVTVAVERGEVRGERTVRLRALNLTVEPIAPLAFPFTGLEVRTRLGGRPAAGVPVTMGNASVGETGPNGTLVAALPLASSAEVTVSRYGQTASATVGGLFVNTALLAAALLAVVVVAARRGVSPRDLLSLVARTARRAVRLAGAALVALAGAVDDALRALARAPGRTAAWLRDLLAGRATLADLQAALLAWLAARRETVTDRMPGGTGGTTPSAAEAGVTDDRLTLREAWDGLLAHTTLPAWRAAASTPGEIASHAVEVDGLPREPVETLRDAYREVEYGGRDPDAEVERAAEALAAVTAAVESRTATDGEDGPTEGGVAA